MTRTAARAIAALVVAAATGCTIYNSGLLSGDAGSHGGTDARGQPEGATADHGMMQGTDSPSPVDARKNPDAGFGCVEGGTGAGNQCGPASSSNCCAAAAVPGGPFLVDDSDAGQANISAFTLDTYEVTVGRFRRFVEAGFGTQKKPPTAGSGANTHIPGSGWSSAWNSQLPSSTADLEAFATCSGGAGPTWTDTVDNNETLPINCVTWFSAFAFCIWDGGRLPTDTEWYFTAAGGNADRYYPWSSPATSESIGPKNANYACNASGSTDYYDAGADVNAEGINFLCPQQLGSLTVPGHYSPLGDGLYGHADLGGSMYEWVLDWAGGTPFPCDDCAVLDAGPDGGIGRLQRGGGYDSPAYDLTTYQSVYADPTVTYDDTGIRCAR